MSVDEFLDKKLDVRFMKRHRNGWHHEEVSRELQADGRVRVRYEFVDKDGNRDKNPAAVIIDSAEKLDALDAHLARQFNEIDKIA